MPRPPLPLNTAGRIGFTTMRNGQVRARANFRDADGRVRPVTRYGPSKSAAERRLKEALRDRSGPAGDEKVTSDTRVRVTAELWRSEVLSSDLADATKGQYELTLNNHVLPGLGDLLVREVDVPTCDRFVRTVSQRSGATAAKNAKSVATLVLQLAVRHGALKANPMRETGRMGHGRKKPPKALSIADEIALVKLVEADDVATEQDLPDVVRFMLGTGCRIGEALAVRPPQVDLEAGVLEVNSTVVRLKGRGATIQDRPKTDAGWRVIALPDDVVELLRRRMATSFPRNDLGLVFPAALGGVRYPSKVQDQLREMLKRAAPELAWCTTHKFRSTVATRLDEAGLSAREIADHLGHSKPSFTQDTYLGRNVATAKAAHVLGRR